MRIISLMLLIISYQAFSQAPQLITGFLSPKSTKSLSQVLKEDARLPSSLYTDSAFIQKIKQLNPEIRDFKQINPKQRLYIEVPYGTKLVQPTIKNPVLPTTPTIRTGYVKSTEQKSLISILKDDARLPDNLVEDPDFINQTKTINPTIKDFDQISIGHKLYLEIPYETDLVDKTKFIETEPFNITEMEYKPTQRERKNTWSLSGFYTVSQGLFNEKIADNEVESTQDSPITIGASALFGMDYQTFYSASFYLAQLDNGVIEGAEEFSLPLEYGATTYLNWQKDWPITPYAGLDYERFSTLNIEEVQSGGDPDPIEHNFAYATVGFGKTFQVMNNTILFKTSVSQTIWANSEGTSESYSGTKYIVFLASKLFKNWSAHVLLKQHFLSGPTELTVTRLGAGIGYTFF